MNYERMFMASVAVLAEITEALGIPADVAATSNGSAEMLAAIKAKHARIAELEQALVHSVYVIQQWHNLQLPERDRSVMWDIYWKNAPEMKQIRTALGKSDAI